MKLLLLDRDGVINENAAGYITTPEDWHPIPGSLAAIARLNQAGYTVAVATNQSAIGRRLMSHTQLGCIHQKMQHQLQTLGAGIDRVFYCPHTPMAGCDCRKPSVGLFMQIAEYYGQSLSEVPFVGDSLSDMKAACTFGGQPILVRTGHGEATVPYLRSLGEPIRIFTNLAAVADFLLAEDTLGNA